MKSIRSKEGVKKKGWRRWAKRVYHKFTSKPKRTDSLPEGSKTADSKQTKKSKIKKIKNQNPKQEQESCTHDKRKENHYG